MCACVCVYVQPLLRSAVIHGMGMNPVRGGSQTPKATTSLLISFGFQDWAGKVQNKR